MRLEQPQQPDQYSFEDYFMIGIYIRHATAVSVLNCSPEKLLREPERVPVDSSNDQFGDKTIR